jgi:hypothetical protein
MEGESKRITTTSKATKRLKGYGNDPFFVKKANESKEFLEKHGFYEAPSQKKIN